MKVALLLCFPSLVFASLSEPDTTFYGRVTHHGGGEPYLLTSGNLVWTIEGSAGSAPVTLRAELTPLENGTMSYSIRVPRLLNVGGVPEYSAPAGLPVLAENAERYRHGAITLNGQSVRIADPAALSFASKQSARASFLRVDLIAEGPFSDVDADGLPDWWEDKYGLNASQAAVVGQDTDGDGILDVAEFAAGTNPSAPGTAPLLTDVAPLSVPENGRAALILRAQDADTPDRLLRYTVQALPPEVTLVIQDGGADGRSDRQISVGSTFTQEEMTNGRVILSSSSLLQSAQAQFSLVDDVPSRTPIAISLPISTVLSTDLATASGVRVSLLPAVPTLHYAAASAAAVTLRTPSSPASAEPSSTTPSYAGAWAEQHGADAPRMLIGSAKDDTLLGSTENDILNAGAGSNVMRGYAGADRFIIASPGSNDRITDFSALERDVLDISNLIKPAAGRTLRDYVSLQGGVLKIDANGDGSGFTDATVTLPVGTFPTGIEEAWDAGNLDAGEVAPRTALFITSTGASEENLQPGSFTIRRRGDSSLPLTIALSIAGSATPGSDYTSLPTSITIPAGVKSFTLPVTPLVDDAREVAETVEVSLASNPSYDLAVGTAQVAILDLPSRVWIEIAERTAYQDSLSPAQIIIRRSGPLGGSLTAYLNAAGRATPALDYRRLASSVTFSAGQDSIPLDVMPLATASLTGGCEDVIISVRADVAYLFGSTPQASILLCTRPQSLAAWLASHSINSDPEDPTAMRADPDGDGFSLLMEFALNLRPKAADSGELTQTKLVFDAMGCPGLEFRRRPGAPEITSEVWQSSDLRNWTKLTDENSAETYAVREADGMERVRRCLKAKPASGQVYLRLKIVR